MGSTNEVAAVEDKAPVFAQIHLYQGIDYQQAGIASVALHVQIVEVFSAINIAWQVFILVAFPREQVEETDVSDESSEILQLNMCLRLDAVAATHIIVALNHVKIVALCAS